MSWHHENLNCPGGDRKHLTMKQHVHLKGMKNRIKNHVKTRKTCKLNNIPTTNCRKLPKKDSVLDMEPLKKICVDTIGPWEISITE